MSTKSNQARPDWLVFLTSYLHSSREVGTPFSCSDFVGKVMASHIPPPDSKISRKYLEVGPGTGVVTEQILKKLGPHDTLDIVEIEKGFYELIKKKFEGDKRVRVHHADIATWKLLDQQGREVQFDAIATCVPLNGLPNIAILTGVLAAYKRLAKKDAEITSLEYVGTTTLSQWIKGKEFKEVIALKNRFYEQFKCDEPTVVYMNFPVPARVHRLKM